MKTTNGSNDILDLEVNRKKTPNIVDNTTTEVSKEQKSILDWWDRISDWFESILKWNNNN